MQIARAVATSARILIFDAATAALTTRETAKLFAFIRAFRAGGGLGLWFVLARTRFGRDIYAVGGDRDAATLVGIRVARIGMAAFGLAGMFSALAGILYARRMDAAQPTVGEGWMLSAITPAILGGASLRGGEGAIVGAMFGAVALVAVLLDALRRK